MLKLAAQAVDVAPGTLALGVITNGGNGETMRELLRTNDPVLISFLEALLRDSSIQTLVLDQNMSIVEGSLGILPRRVLVAEDDHARALRLVREAGIETCE